VLLIFRHAIRGIRITVSPDEKGSKHMLTSMRNRLRLPSRVALLFGLSALSVAGAKASTPDTVRPDNDRALAPQQSAKAVADLLIWRDDGRIYTSEAGKPAEELQLGDTAEAALLGQLLDSQNATPANPYRMRDRIILVGGGGCGFDWTPPGKTAVAPRAHVNDKPSAGTPQTSLQRSAPSTEPATTASGQPATGKTSLYP
jgi:hypothetical protein